MNNSKSQSNDIHIALGFDNNYIVHIYAMIASVLINNKNNNIIFHAIATGIAETEKSELSKFINDSNANIIFYKLNEEKLKENIILPEDCYFTLATFYKWFFPELINSDIQKLLYLDPDIIVIGNLSKLYNINIGTSPIAAVVDTGIEVREDLGIKVKESYFNAGVLLIDIKNWNNQKITEKAFEFVRSYPGHLQYLDQDALNGTLVNNWFKLDNKYNFASHEVKLQIPTKKLIKDKVIIHFTSYNKPWLFLTRNKLRYLYHYYLKKSPKSTKKKYTDFKWNLKDIWIFARIRMKEFYFDHQIDKILPVKKWMKPSWDY